MNIKTLSLKNLCFYFALGFTSFLIVVQQSSLLQEISMMKYVLLYTPRWLIVFPLFILMCFLKGSKIYFKIIFCLLLLLALFYNGLTIPIKTVEKKLGQEVSIMTLNVSQVGRFDKLLQLAEFYYPDIFLLQESSLRDVEILKKYYPYTHCAGSLCIASQHDFSVSNIIGREIFGGWGNFAVTYDVIIQDKTLVLANVHFDTPRHALINTIMGKGFQKLFIDLDENRRLQANLVSQFMQNRKYSVIAGDFNMPVDENIYRDSFDGFSNAISEYSMGFNFTKFVEVKGVPLYGIRIDHILFSSHFHVVKAKVLGNVGSDHMPVYAILRTDNAS